LDHGSMMGRRWMMRGWTRTGLQLRTFATPMSLYWKCQIVGWSFYGLLAAGIPTLYGGMRWTVALRAAVGVAIGLYLTDHLRKLMLRRRWPWLPLGRLAPRVVLAAIVVAGLMVLLLLP